MGHRIPHFFFVNFVAAKRLVFQFVEFRFLSTDHELGRFAAIGPPNITLQTHFTAAGGTSKPVERSVRTSSFDPVDQFHGGRTAGTATRHLDDVPAADTGKAVVCIGIFGEEIVPQSALTAGTTDSISFSHDSSSLPPTKKTARPLGLAVCDNPFDLWRILLSELGHSDLLYRIVTLALVDGELERFADLGTEQLVAER